MASVKSLPCCTSLDDLLAYASAAVEDSKKYCTKTTSSYLSAYNVIANLKTLNGNAGSSTAAFKQGQDLLFKANNTCNKERGMATYASLPACGSSSSAPSTTDTTVNASPPLAPASTGSGTAAKIGATVVVAGILWWLTRKPKKTPKQNPGKKSAKRRRK